MINNFIMKTIFWIWLFAVILMALL